MLANRLSPKLYFLVGFALVATYFFYTYPQQIEKLYRKPFSRPAVPDGQFDWSQRQENHPVSKKIPLPKRNPVQIPRIQHSFSAETRAAKEERLERRDAVRAAFIRSWNGYRDHAWMKDELTPLSGSSREHFGGWGATLVDSLDTLWIMGMIDEFEQAVEAVGRINFWETESEEINIYEITIRYIGGLLSAYELSKRKYEVLLEKAVMVGDFVYAAFDTENRMPVTRWKWKLAKEGENYGPSNRTVLAEIASLGLEFTRLSQLSGDPKFYDAIHRIYDTMQEQQLMTNLPGLWPIVVNAQEKNFTQDTSFSMGGMSDSAYECLPKQYLLLSGRLYQPQKLYQKAIQTTIDNLLFSPMNELSADILFPGIMTAGPDSGSFTPQAEHLSCFLGGTMALGSKIFERPGDLEIAEKLVKGCIWANDASRSGIIPETFKLVQCFLQEDKRRESCRWDRMKWYGSVIREHNGVTVKNVEQRIRQYRLQPGFVRVTDPKYILRPETIESIFTLYRVTGSADLLDSAWEIFFQIERSTATDLGNAAIEDVTTVPSTKSDSMNSFWMAQTLKYFYLLFSEPHLLSLDEWVFNTGGHVLGRGW